MRGVRIHLQAFIARHGQKHSQGRTNGQTGTDGARQKSNQVNGCGLRSANNIQRARQRDNQVTSRRSGNQTTRQHGKTWMKTSK